MNNLSNERLKSIADLDSPECMAFPPSHDQCATMARELLAYREAATPIYQFIYNNPHEEGYVEWLDCNKEFYDGVPKDCRRVLYAAPQLPAVPDVLPCSVKLEPGLILGKGVRTQVLLDALCRREKYYAELEAMTPEQRADKDKLMDELRQMLGHSKPTDDERIMAIEGIIQPLDEFDSSSQQFESLRRGESD